MLTDVEINDNHNHEEYLDFISRRGGRTKWYSLHDNADKIVFVYGVISMLMIFITIWFIKRIIKKYCFYGSKNVIKYGKVIDTEISDTDTDIA